MKQPLCPFSVRRILTLLLGAFILAFGLYNIHSRCAITEGGILGLTLLLQHHFSLTPGITGIVMDLTCYLVGYKLLGKTFLQNAIVASCGFSLFYNLLECFPPLLPNLSACPLLAAVLGACFVGVGVGLVVRLGGAAGGDDALALVIQHLSKCRISTAYLMTDLTVLTLSLTYIPLQKILYSLVTVTVSSVIIDKIQTYQRK